MAVNELVRQLCEDLRLLRGQRHPTAAEEHRQALRQKSRQRRSALALYSGLLFWGILAAWAMFNIISSKLPVIFNIDASDDQIYSLSEASGEILQALERDVTIYALFSEGNYPTRPLEIYRYLELYAASSSYVHLQVVDPELQPELVRPFITGVNRQGRGINKAPKRNSLIVFSKAENGQSARFRIIDYRDLYYKIKGFGLKNSGIMAEQQISSAIAYINGAKLVRLGLLGGHREQDLASAGLSPNFAQFNMEAQGLKLLPKSDVLQSLDVLLAYKPQLDLSEEEYHILSSYLEKGKAMWLILDSQAEYLPYFYQLSKDYGLGILEGLVMERDSQRIQAGRGYTTFITPINALPKPSENEDLHPIVRSLRENKTSELLWVQSMAVRESLPHPKPLRFYSLVESSRSSLLRTSRDPSNMMELAGDVTGPLSLVAMSAWLDEQGKRSGPAMMISFDVAGAGSVYSTPSNLQLFYSALTWLGDSEGKESQLVFPSKSLLMLPLRLSQTQAIWWAVIFVLLLPLLVLILGLLFLRHRNKL